MLSWQNIVSQEQRRNLATVCPQRREGRGATGSTLRNSGQILRRGYHRTENMASGYVVAYHLEGSPTILPRVRSMPTVGSALRMRLNATSTCATLGAISEMEPFSCPTPHPRPRHVQEIDISSSERTTALSGWKQSPSETIRQPLRRNFYKNTYGADSIAPLSL